MIQIKLSKQKEKVEIIKQELEDQKNLKSEYLKVKKELKNFKKLLEEANSDIFKHKSDVEKYKKLLEEALSNSNFKSSQILQNEKINTKIESQEIAKISELSQCGFSRVYIGARQVAIKDINMSFNKNNNFTDELEMELNITKRLKHPNIVEYYGYYLPEDNNTISIVMELCSDGNLFDLVHKLPLIPLNNMQKIRLLIDLVKALKYIHSMGVAHRNLKPSNILIKKHKIGMEESYTAKLSDFRLPRVGPSRRLSIISAVVETQEYIAPEVLKNMPNDSRSDVYSLGVIAWEVFSRRIPYADGPYKDCSNLTIPVAQYNARPDLTLMDCTTPVGLIEIIKNCWEDIPENRPTLDQILMILFEIENFYQIF